MSDESQNQPAPPAQPRRRRSSSERLADVTQQIARLEAEKRRLNAQESAEKRKREDRRKFLAGHVVLTHAEHDDAFRAQLVELLNRFLTREIDRKAFDELAALTPPEPPTF